LVTIDYSRALDARLTCSLVIAPHPQFFGQIGGILSEVSIRFSRLLPIIVLSLAAVVAGAAENATGPGPRPGPNRTAYLDKVTILLDLNAGQKVQVEQILDEQHQQQRTQMQALREQARSSGQRPDFDQVQKQRLQAETDLIDKLRPVLTDVQLKKFEVLRELTSHKHRKHGPHARHQERR
jgi:Spy/CpxP family protein refolding chaperone